MANLDIVNNLIGGTPPDFLYCVNDGTPISISPNGGSANIGNYNYKDKLTFRINGTRNTGNAISFAHKYFTHCIEIIDTDIANNNFIKIRIAPIPIFDSSSPDCIIIANQLITPSIEPRGKRILPKKIVYSFNNDNQCTLEVNLNSMTRTYIPSVANSGTITEYLGDNGIAEFQVIGELQYNYLIFNIKLAGIFSIRITVTINSNFSEVTIFEDTGTIDPSPQSINITIEPDNP